MTRLTCKSLLLEACHQSCVPVNILDQLQIPQFRLVAQIRLPVLDAPGKRPLWASSGHDAGSCIVLAGTLNWSSKCLASGRSRLVWKLITRLRQLAPLAPTRPPRKSFSLILSLGTGTAPWLLRFLTSLWTGTAPWLPRSHPPPGLALPRGS